jgi:hypothetical protein
LYRFCAHRRQGCADRDGETGFERTKKSTKESFAALANSLTKKTTYKGLGADSEEKHEPVSDIDTPVVGSLKVVDPKRPIREADI